jgi:uncharacterized protein (TIGR02611 family)
MRDVARVLRRIAITVAGVIVLVIGVVLLVAPGPGVLVILLGMALFALEYEWARRRLIQFRARALSAAEKAAASRVATASTVVVSLGVIGLGTLLIFTDFFPLSGVGTGVGVAAGGLVVLITTVYSVIQVRRAEAGLGGSRDQTPR